MEELKVPEIGVGEMAEEIIFDNVELKTVRYTFRGFSDGEGATRAQEEGEWLSVLKGEITLVVGEKTVTLKNAQKTFIPSMTPYKIVNTSDPCMVLAVFHK